jgi:hypothetical protein
LYGSNAYNHQVAALRINQSDALKFLTQNLLIFIQIVNGFWFGIMLLGGIHLDDG